MPLTDPQAHPEPPPGDAARVIRRHTRCVALADETPYDCRFLVDGQSGELVLGVEQTVLDAEQLVLCLPDDSFDPEATMLVVHRTTGEDQWTDRHMAYHPDNQPPRWARAVVDAVKLRSGEVFAGDQLQLINPLLRVEPALCKRLNADRDALRELCRLLTGVEPEEPVAVGVDRLGIDVRARFGVIRVELPAPCDDVEEAARVVEALIGGAR